MFPTATHTAPQDIMAAHNGFADFSFNVDPGAVPGDSGNVTFTVRTSQGEELTREFALRVEGEASCCNHDGIRGDVNSDMGLNVADLTYLVDFLFKGGPPPPCEDPPGQYPRSVPVGK